MPPPPREINQTVLKIIKEEKSTIFKPNYVSWTDNVFLKGYWQFEDYFSDQERILREELVFKTPLTEASRIWANRIRDDPMPISIHVRRGDYLTQINQTIFATVSMQYYMHCVGFLRENFPEISLYVFSDDLNWCRTNLNFGVPTYFVDCNDESGAYDDLCLMSLCRHHIIANSTFSWWGAWLDNRVGSLVFAPRKMYHNYDPVLEFNRLPSRWIIFDY